MTIDDDHMYHGAALIQIAEDPQFTAINAFVLGSTPSRSAYRINDNIGVFLKYASKPTSPHREYAFTFRKEHLAELAEMADVAPRVFAALVCVKVRQICCLPYSSLIALIEARKRAKGKAENQYLILVTALPGKSFRVYVNKPGVRNTMLGKAIIIPRNNFPSNIFS